MATKEQIAKVFAGKIDSPEAYQAALKELGATEDFPVALGLMSRAVRRIGGRDTYVPDTPSWWTAREVIREHAIYPEESDTLCVLRHQNPVLRHHHLHISHDDPTMVAYTATWEDGLRDRQLRTTLGKALRKLLLHLRDEDIQRLEACHRSDSDPVFSIALTAAEVTRVYMNMAGDTGCMRYNAEYFGLPVGKHPSTVFVGNGMGVAYVEVEGVIKSRAVIFNNPDDTNDKRYVRIYGDGALKRKLQLAGYREGDLSGAKLALVPVNANLLPTRLNGRAVVMAYLDGPDGRQSHPDGHVITHIEGENFLRVLSREQQLAYVGARSHCFVSAKNTGGQITLTSIPTDLIEYVCFLSNERCSSASKRPIQVFIDGVVRKVSPDIDLSRWPARMRVCAADGDGTLLSVRCTEADYEAGYRRSSIADPVYKDARSLGLINCVLLSETCYPAGTVAEALHVHHLDIPGETGEIIHYALKGDVYRNVAENATTFIHRSTADALKKARTHISLGVWNGYKTLAAVDNPNLVTTVSGKKALRGVHEIVELFGGGWEKKILTQMTSLFGHRVRILSSRSSPWIDSVTDAQIQGLATNPNMRSQNSGESRENWRARAKRDDATIALRQGLNGEAYPMSGGRFVSPYGASFDQLISGVTTIAGATDEQLAYLGAYDYNRVTMHNWARLSRVYMDARNAFIDARFAAADALVAAARGQLAATLTF